MCSPMLVIDCSPHSSLALARFPATKGSCGQTPYSHTLADSFSLVSDSLSLFSTSCELFSQNTRGGGSSLRFLRALCVSALSVVCAFVRPLFSYCYELLFPQFLCFDNDLNCPGVWE